MGISSTFSGNFAQAIDTAGQIDGYILALDAAANTAQTATAAADADSVAIDNYSVDYLLVTCTLGGAGTANGSQQFLMLPQSTKNLSFGENFITEVSVQAVAEPTASGAVSALVPAAAATAQDATNPSLVNVVFVEQ